MPADAVESDEGETKDSDGGAPSTSAPVTETATSGTKAKKSKKSKKKRKKKAASGHSSVCSDFELSPTIDLSCFSRVKANLMMNQQADQRKRKRRKINE